MKFKQFNSYEMLDALADILDPTAVILTNEDVKDVIKTYKNKLEIVKVILKKCPKEIIEILARLDDTPVDDYKISLVTVPMAVLEILNDETISDFFKLQGQTLVDEVSGSATENIEDKK